MRPHLSQTTMRNVLTLDRDVLLTSQTFGYDIEFSRWIWIKIHERAFKEFTTFSFPWLIQILCDDVWVPGILDIDQRVEVTCMSDIGFIKNATNPIVL